MRHRHAEPHAVEGRHARFLRSVVVGVGVVHLQGLKHLGLNEFLPRPARHRLQHGAEQHEVEVAVFVTLAHRAVERHGAEPTCQVLDAGGAALQQRRDAIRARKAAGLVEHVAHCDARRRFAVCHTEPGQVALHRRVHIELAGVDGLSHQQRGERLGDRADRKRRVGADGRATPVVAESAHVGRAAQLHDRQRDARDARGLPLAFDEVIDAIAPCGIGRWRLLPRDRRDQAAPKRRHATAGCRVPKTRPG